jgi:CBS domain-containing protein
MGGSAMYEFLGYRVEDFMSRSGITVKRTTRLDEAERLFEKHDFNLLPVVEGSRLVGVLTKLDFLKAFSFRHGDLIPPYHAILQREIAAVMTNDPVTLEPDLPLTRVLEKMIDTRYKSFPVVREGELVGMISREDVVRALRQAAHGTAR